jgi:hypothetical protein
MPRQWMHQDTRENQLSEAGLDAAGLAREIRAILEAPDHPSSRHASAVASTGQRS